MGTRFHVTRSHANENRDALVLEGKAVGGWITRGMQAHVPLNRTLSVTLVITEVRTEESACGEEIVSLTVGCEDEEELELLEALDIREEELEIHLYVR
jgi:hypothetical protein